MSQRRQLDATGTFCPVPILLTARAMAALEPGDELEVRGDDPGILEDMPVWCEETGHRLVSMVREQGVIICLVVCRVPNGEAGHRAGP